MTRYYFAISNVAIILRGKNLSTKETGINQHGHGVREWANTTCLPNTTLTRSSQIRWNLWKTNPIFGHTLSSLSSSFLSSAIQIPHNPVSSPGIPSNFHLNFIPSSLDKIRFGLGKTTKLQSFPVSKKGVGVNKERNIAKRNKDKSNREKRSSHLSLFGFTGYQLSATVTYKGDGNSYFNIVSVKCTE